MARLFPIALLFVASALFADGGEVPWAKGERLFFRLSWGFVSAGSADMNAYPRDDGKIEFVSIARNNGAFKSIYPVADTIRTVSSANTLLPETFRKILNEGSYFSTSQIFFDRNAQKASLSDTVFTGARRDKIKASVDTVLSLKGDEHCIISAFYQVRRMDLTGRKDAHFSAVSGKKRYLLRVIVHGREIVETKLGKFECVKVEPVLGDDGAFKASGRLFIWLTDDDRRLPVLMRVKIPIGSIKGELVKFSQGSAE